MLCKGECFAKKRALQRRVLCKESVLLCRSVESALQRKCSVFTAPEADSFISLVVCLHKQKIFDFAPEVLCKEACCKEAALQRRVLRKGSVFTAPEADSPKLIHLFL